MAKTDEKPPAGTAGDAPLNPALRKVHDRSYSRDHQGSDPMKTVSVKGTEGRPWPIIWAVVVIVCVLATIGFLFF